MQPVMLTLKSQSEWTDCYAQVQDTYLTTLSDEAILKSCLVIKIIYDICFIFKRK